MRRSLGRTVGAVSSDSDFLAVSLFSIIGLVVSVRVLLVLPPEVIALAFSFPFA